MKFSLLIISALFASQSYAESQPLALSAAVSGAVNTTQGKLELSIQAQENVLSSYFQAVIADLEFQAAAEHVSMDYIRLSRQQQEGNGSVDSEIEIKAAEVQYRKSLERRWTAAQKQRQNRESLKRYAHLNEPPDQLEAISLPELPQTLPSLDRLVQAMLKQSKYSRQINPSTKSRTETASLQSQLESKLIEAYLDLNRLLNGSLPRVRVEAEHADMVLDKAREDLAAGRKSDIGYAMARSSDIAVKEAQVAADISLALWRLETITGVRINTLN